MADEKSKRPPTREDVELAKIFRSVKITGLVADTVSKCFKWGVILFMVWAAKAAIFELSRTPNQDTAQLIVELLHEVLSEKGLFSVVMTVAGWIGAAILAALTGVLLYLNRKQKQRLDELEKGGTHERIADTHSDNRGDHRRLRD